MARAAVAHMQPGSAIINTGSITGIQGSKQLLDYSATKPAKKVGKHGQGEVLTLLGGETTGA